MFHYTRQSIPDTHTYKKKKNTHRTLRRSIGGILLTTRLGGTRLGDHNGAPVLRHADLKYALALPRYYKLQEREAGKPAETKDGREAFLIKKLQKLVLRRVELTNRTLTFLTAPHSICTKYAFT